MQRGQDMPYLRGLSLINTYNKQ